MTKGANVGVNLYHIGCITAEGGVMLVAPWAAACRRSAPGAACAIADAEPEAIRSDGKVAEIALLADPDLLSQLAIEILP